jgi:hypothetical protein
MKPKPSCSLFCVCDPDGNLVFTTISTTEKDSIKEWMDQERVTEEISNLGRVMRGEPKTCCPSWEQFEAQGYTIVSVVLLPATGPEPDRMSK